MIAFIDTEVSVQTHNVMDYGAVRDDGTAIHTKSESEFNAFIEECDTLCGHNIINHDLKYINVNGKYTIIDTLYLSPLLFPRKPYHHLLKDDKIITDEFNNPTNDAKKTRNLFYDEIEAWQKLTPEQQTIFASLLVDTKEFGGFFKQIRFYNTIDKALLPQQIANNYEGKICASADLAPIIKYYPIELAYALSIINADDLMSLTPAWVLRNHPKVANVMSHLRNKTCGECEYCHSHLDARHGLKEFFGYDGFRLFDGKPMQEQTVEAALRGESLLCIFPTGGGKSITFQVPALMAGRNIHGLTVVISPLQSLMKDQVDNLAEHGIGEAVTINGLLDPIERAAAIKQVEDGTANLLYIAPEMLRSKTIERLLLGRNVVRIVIDEAHCFSAWGHDFRVDYLFIGDFIRTLQENKQQQQPIAVSCFTATAKQKVISDICDYFENKLGLTLKVFAASTERKNLHYSVIHSDTDDEKYNYLRQLILGHQCPTIVYVSRTKRTKEICDHLRADGIKALPFNGKMDPADKVKNQNAFMSGETQVIVATSAFGMGVDKKDVRLVVHYDISDSLENYVQEAGRAGRDPNIDAACYVLYTDSDLDKHFILLNQTKLSLSEIQQIWRALRDLGGNHQHINCTPLEIARQAGWADDTVEIETRVKAAIAALEDAGYVKRGSNTPYIFATGIKVKNMDEARSRITASTLFDEKSREEAVRIIRSLISRHSTTKADGNVAESRIDYLADILGMDKETVIRNVSLMRQEGLLADSKDLSAWITKSTVIRDLDNSLKLEKFVLSHISEIKQTLNYKALNEEAQSNEMKQCTVRRLKMITYFLKVKEYIRKEEHSATDSVTLQLTNDRDTIMQRYERRSDICHFIINRLNQQKDQQEQTKVIFSEIELLENYNTSRLLLDEPATISDIEEALLYLTKTDLMKIEGGFLVSYNNMQLERIAKSNKRYGKEQYRTLDEFYKQRIQQIHIVGEYANLMVRDYDAAIQYVNDYFTMDYKKFINKYFKDDRKKQISKNISPEKYNKIFGALSQKQLEIINDKESQYIVVAAGPGSGKTRVLVHKMASLLLLEDVKHEQLLMLTFSRAAATEFKKRLMDLVGNAAHYIDIKTFHSYAFDLLGHQGSLEESDSVVRRAAEMIENGDVEIQKTAKSVLVIDEAQDMGADDYRLVEALMKQNEEMRIIAVGDDDQNIYTFRGSDSAHLKSLITDYKAKGYEMTDNYRSCKEIVCLANNFVTRLPSRLKSNLITAVSAENGIVEAYTDRTVLTTLLQSITANTAFLTTTNEDAMGLAYLLEKQGIPTTFVQSTSGFRFINLAEVRYFVKQLRGNAPTANEQSRTISSDTWKTAKERTIKTYSNSRMLPAMKRFWHDYEKTNKTYYFSDLHQFLLESDASDFVTDSNTVFVSTIHKAKGREFDTVYLMADRLNNEITNENLRTLYVGITRAKRQLYIIGGQNVFSSLIPYHKTETTSSDSDNKNLFIALDMHDVNLGHFKDDRKEQVLRLRSGEHLQYKKGYLVNERNEYVAQLSKTKYSEIQKWESKGYEVVSAEVSYVLAWRPRDERTEVAVCLANLHLSK